MLIVDSQIHIWNSGIPTNPSHRQIPRYSQDDALREMAEAGVDAAVLHPPGWDPQANEVAVEAARQHPNRFAILGNFPLDRLESRALVDGWKQRPGMLGLRFTFLQPHQRTWPTDGTLDWLWPAAERAGLPVGLAAANFLPVVGQAAGNDQHPGVGLAGAESLDGEADEVVAVAGDEDARVAGGRPELLVVGEASAVDLVDADRVEPESARDLGGLRVDVLVQEEAHRRGQPVPGGVANGISRRMRSGIQPSSRSRRSSISRG